MVDCPACCCREHVIHPQPHPDRSVLSDGRTLPYALRRMTCLACGLGSHVEALSEGQIRSFYDGSYDLGASPGAAEISRADAHAGMIEDAWGEARTPRRILEVGCGAGLVLDALAERWGEATLVGLEAAPQLANRLAGSKIAVHQGFFEDLPNNEDAFHLIYAINVLEHAANPVDFLRAAVEKLTPDGQVILMVPRAAPPNLELVFMDHVHTFTPAALARLASQAGLSLIRQPQPPKPVGDFSVYVLAREGAPAAAAMPEDVSHLGAQRSAYFSAWSRLDEVLASRIGVNERIMAFGAGEAAALIRAYAPAAWARIECLLVDEAFAARVLDKPVRQYDPKADYPSVMLAVHPRSQSRLAGRIRADGHSVIVWDDLIPQ